MRATSIAAKATGQATLPICFTLLLVLLTPITGKAERLDITAFTDRSLDGWQEKEFKGRTGYQLVELDRQTVLEAVSQGSASGLFKEVEVDLSQTPYLNWSWRTEEPLPPLDEQSREGDDYRARVYVVIDGGLLFWNTRALNYVWSSQQDPPRSWANAYAGSNAMMIPLRTADTPTGIWQQEKRNVLEDLRAVFGKELAPRRSVWI